MSLPAEPAAAPSLQTLREVQVPGLDRQVTGRAVFAVRILGNAVSVESAFLAENGEVLRLPAVFPTREYALAQMEELRSIVLRNFDEIDAKGLQIRTSEEP